MRNLRLLILLIPLLLSVTRAGSQSFIREHFKPQRKIIKFNVLSPLVTTLSLQYERPIDNHSSSQVGIFVFLGLQSQPIRGLPGGGGFGITYDYRFYLTSEDQTGFYVQPYLRYQYYYLTATTRGLTRRTLLAELRMNIYGGGIVLGRQWIIGKHISIDLYCGPLYNMAVMNSGIFIGRNDYPPMLNGFWYRTGMTLGYAF